MSNKAFSKRWGKELTITVIRFFTNGGIIECNLSPFENTKDGFQDFRGVKLEYLRIEKGIFENIDFSFSSFKSTWIGSSSYKKCLFTGTNLSNVSDHGNEFTGCNFMNAKFNYAALGYNGSIFRDCVFENSSFQKAVFIRGEFIRCSFINCNIKGIDFNASSFEYCSFEGILDDVWFRGSFPLQSDIQHFGIPKQNRMKEVSFEKAELRNLTFSNGCDLSTVRLGNNPLIHKYANWGEKLKSLEKEISYWDFEDRKQAEIFVKTHLVHAENQDWHIISLHELERSYGAILASKIVKVLDSENS